MHWYLNTYKIEKLFYLQKVYILFKKSLIWRWSIYEGDIAFKDFNLRNKSKTSLISNVASRNLSFFILHQVECK